MAVTLMAGSQQAAIPTRVRMAGTITKVVTSQALTTNNMLCTALAAARAMRMPVTTPIATSRVPSLRIIPRTSPAVAPSAIRTPNSRTRWLTEYEITP